MFALGLFGVLLLAFSSSFTMPNQLGLPSHNIKIVKRAADVPESPVDPDAQLLAAAVVLLPVLPCNSSARQVHYGETVMIESPNFGSITDSQGNAVSYDSSKDCLWRFWAEDCEMKLSCPLFALDEFFCVMSLEVARNNSNESIKYCGIEGPKELPVTKFVDIRYTRSKTEQVEQNWKDSGAFQCQISCPYQELIFDDNTGASPRKS